MLINLFVLDYQISPSFDPLNNLYTVTISEEVERLIISYEAEDDCIVNIIGNENLSIGENNIYIEVIQDNKINTYTIVAIKEETAEVIGFEDFYEPIEVTKEAPTYTAPAIAIVCFLIILFTYGLLFSRKKRR